MSKPKSNGATAKEATAHAHPVGDVVKRFNSPLDLMDFMSDEDAKNAFEAENDAKYGKGEYHLYINPLEGVVIAVKTADEPAFRAESAVEEGD